MHCHDYPSGDTRTYEYKVGFKYCVIHHQFGYLASCSSSLTPVIDVVNLDDERKNGKTEKGVKKESAASKKSKDMITFAESDY
jgi:hypothetical protein